MSRSGAASAAGRAPPGRRRRWLLRVGVLLAVLAVASAMMLRHVLEPERLSALLLGQMEQASGLELVLSEPAGVGWWPDLHISLRGLEARQPGSQAPVLRAQRVELVLPWSSIDEPMPVIERLRVVGPELRLDLLQAWLDSRPEPEGPPEPLLLPRFSGSLAIADGVLLAGPGDLLADAIAIDLPQLLPGTALSIRASARLARAEAEPLPVELELATTVTETPAGLALDDLELGLSLAGREVQVDLAGRAALEPPTRYSANLAGTLAKWPPSWPALPLPASEAPISLRLDYLAGEDAGSLDATLVRDQARAEIRLAVAELLGWLGDEDASPLPPIEVDAGAPRIEHQGTVIEGLELELRPDPEAAEQPH